MILYINKKKDGVTTNTAVYGGNISFAYWRGEKVLNVWLDDNNTIYDYAVKDINVGLNGHIVDALLDDEDEQ